MFQMFKRNAKNISNEISDAEANIIASRKLRFWLRRIACAMAKTKAMCIINPLQGHEKDTWSLIQKNRQKSNIIARIKVIIDSESS